MRQSKKRILWLLPPLLIIVVLGVILFNVFNLSLPRAVVAAFNPCDLQKQSVNTAIHLPVWQCKPLPQLKNTDACMAMHATPSMQSESIGCYSIRRINTLPVICQTLGDTINGSPVWDEIITGGIPVVVNLHQNRPIFAFIWDTNMATPDFNTHVIPDCKTLPQGNGRYPTP